MAILTFPTVSPNSASWWLQSNAATFKSPLSGTVQTRAWPGQHWRAKLTFTDLSGDDLAAMETFLDMMGGRENRVYYGPPHRTSPRGTGNGSPAVNGAGQTGLTLVTDGWAASETVLKAGDFFAFNVGGRRSLHRVRTNVQSDSSGNATPQLVPAIRVAPADNEPLILTHPSCVMMFLSDGIEGQFRPGVFGAFQIDLMEALV